MPFVNHRARIELQLAADQHADAVELVLGNRRRLALERDDVDDAGALQDRQGVGGIEAREAVAGKQRPVDLLLAILPAAPAGDRRQERFDVLALQLLADDLLVPRARPDGEPLWRAGSAIAIVRICGRRGVERRLRLRLQSLLVGLLHVRVLPLDDRLGAQLLEILLELAPCACR